MNDRPLDETNDPKEVDTGEVFRPSSRQLPPGPLPPRDRKVLMGLLAAAAAFVAVVVAVTR